MSVYRGLIALTLVFLLVGCSSIQLAYNKAPFLLQYQMDNYLDLTAEQEDVLRQELLAFQAWHRREALPEYASTLRVWSAELSEPRTFTAAEVLKKQALFQDAMLSMAQQSALRLAPLLLTLKPEQQKRLESRFEKANREYAKDNLRNPTQSEEKRRERFTERFENWLGPLTETQKTSLTQWLESNPSGAALWSQERQARQQALLALMAQARTQPSAEEAAQSLHDYFQSLANYRVSELQAKQPERQQSLANLTAGLLNQMNDRQRDHLRKKLASYAQDFEALADRG
jgi:hypothetical protein